MTIAGNANWWENAINVQDEEIQVLRDKVEQLERQLSLERGLCREFAEALERARQQGAFGNHEGTTGTKENQLGKEGE